MNICLYVCMSVRKYRRTYVGTYVRAYLSMYCMCVCMYVCMYAVFCPRYFEWWLDCTLHLVLFVQFYLSSLYPVCIF